VTCDEVLRRWRGVVKADVEGRRRRVRRARDVNFIVGEVVVIVLVGNFL